MTGDHPTGIVEQLRALALAVVECWDDSGSQCVFTDVRMARVQALASLLAAVPSSADGKGGDVHVCRQQTSDSPGSGVQVDAGVKHPADNTSADVIGAMNDRSALIAEAEFEKLWPESLLRHVVTAPSQYDASCRAMAAEILRTRAAYAALCVDYEALQKQQRLVSGAPQRTAIESYRVEPDKDDGEWHILSFTDGKQVQIFTDRPLVIVEPEQH